MEIASKEHIINISNKAQAFQLVRRLLKTTYPIALWRLPQTNEHFVLIDIRQTVPESTLEDLDQCFIINSYGNSHPPRPVILSGDIIVKINDDHAEATFSPALSANHLDAFFKELNEAPVRQEKSFKHSDCTAYQELVTRGIEKIKSGDAEKIVLSRYQDYHLPEDFDPLQVYEKLTGSYPNAFCYLTSTEESGLWIGATPEKMIAIESERVFSTDALAGTQPLAETDNLGQIAWTQKEIEEQAMVCRYIISCFKQIRLREYDEIGPKTAKAGNLAHLKTEYKVDMVATNSPLLGSTMLDLLHPTSAVCGHPRTIANQFIQENEGYDRELYAGFLGPVGFNGNTRLFVNLRCMKVNGTTARLFAGAGITEDSVPSQEFSETEHKMQTLLRVLGL